MFNTTFNQLVQNAVAVKLILSVATRTYKLFPRTRHLVYLQDIILMDDTDESQRSCGDKFLTRNTVFLVWSCTRLLSHVQASFVNFVAKLHNGNYHHALYTHT